MRWAPSSAKLFTVLRAREGNDVNIVFSPASAYLALGMVSEGAAGDTRTAFEAVLSAAEDASISELCKSLSTILTDKEGDTQIYTANGVWTAEDLTILPSFEEALQINHNAALYQTDFSAKSSVTDINRWVSDNTDGKINGILQSPDASIRMLLVNTVTLSAKWLYPFEASNTRPMTFYGTEEEMLGDFMTQTEELSYVFNEDYMAVSLPYRDSGLALLAVMPRKENVTPEECYCQHPLSEILEEQQTGLVWLALPKLDEDVSYNLTSPLGAIGLQSAMEPTADFSGITADDALYIDTVMQKVVFRMDEKGTEAAAVTSITVYGTSSVNMEDPVSLIFDHPFFYAVVDTKTALPVFVGSCYTLTE